MVGCHVARRHATAGGGRPKFPGRSRPQVQYRHLLAERRKALRDIRGNERALALVWANLRSYWTWLYDNFSPHRRQYWYDCTELNVHAAGPLGRGIMYACVYAWEINTTLDSDDTDMSSDSTGSDDEWRPGDA